jgi:hypothetical protein
MCTHQKQKISRTSRMIHQTVEKTTLIRTNGMDMSGTEKTNPSSNLVPPRCRSRHSASTVAAGRCRPGLAGCQLGRPCALPPLSPPSLKPAPEIPLQKCRFKRGVTVSGKDAQLFSCKDLEFSSKRCGWVQNDSNVTVRPWICRFGFIFCKSRLQPVHTTLRARFVAASIHMIDE